jgi:hypothetical protein
MATAVLRKEEGFGLVLAIAAHAGLVAWLVLRPPMPEPLPLPETMTVTLSDEVGLTSTSPEPAAAPSPDSATEIGEAPPPPEPVARIEPVPASKFVPRPVPKATPKPVVPQRAAPAPRPTPRPTTAPPRNQPPAKAGGSRLGDDFLKGVPNAQATGASPYLPASQIGASVRSSLSAAISRELKPRWVAPQGAEAEKLVTILAFDLNPDGSLAGSPRLVRQEGITDANRAQAPRHLEQAIRAVRLAAPFDLPPQYYNAWKRITAFRFDRRLSQ